jgi:predicted permease
MMSWLNLNLTRALTLFGKDSLDRELREELHCHLELLIEEGRLEGMTYEEARRRAFWILGNPEVIRENSIGAATPQFFDHLLVDIKLGLADLKKCPALYSAAVLMLASGLVTAGMTLVIASFWHKTPSYGPGGQEVFLINHYAPKGIGKWNGFEAHFVPNTADFIRWKTGAKSFSEICIASLLPKSVNATLSPNSGSTALSASFVGPEFFHLLGVKPYLGRTFDPASSTTDWRSVVLSRKSWQTLFHSDSQILNRVIAIEGTDRRVIGVMPEGFLFPNNSDIWLPQQPSSSNPAFQFHGWLVLARLAPGHNESGAEAELNAMGSEGTSLNRLQPISDIYDQISPFQFRLLLSAAGTVFAIACFSAWTLIRVRIGARQQEFAAQVVLGASPGRIVRQVLAQFFLLGSAAWICSIPTSILATWILFLWTRRSGEGGWFFAPKLYMIEVLVTMALAALAVVPCGIFPAINALPGRSLLRAGVLRSVLHERFRLGSLPLVFQLSFAIVLFVGAGTTFRAFFLSWLSFSHQHNSATLLAANISFNGADSAITKPEVNGLYKKIQEDLASMPGIISVSLTNALPFDGTPAVGNEVQIEGSSSRLHTDLAVIRNVAPGYFTQLSIPLLQGRPTETSDREANVAWISNSLAHSFFHGESPIGRRIRTVNPREVSHWMTIVGVVGDLRTSPFSNGPEPTLYRSYQESVNSETVLLPQNILLRTTRSSEQYRPLVAARLRGINPSLRIHNLGFLPEGYWRSINVPVALTMLFAMFSAIALLLTAASVYGAQCHWVAERRREIAIRIASGASRRHVLGMGLRHGVTILLLGLGAGTPVAIATAYLLRHWLWIPVELSTFISCSAALACIVCCASSLPLLSASKIEPVSILRSE